MKEQKNILNYDINPEEKSVETSRKAAGSLLEDVDEWEDLNAETLEEGDQKFILKLRELWGGNLASHKNPDLDAKSGIGIFKLAGVSAKNIQFVEKGEFAEGKINIDTGSEDGFVIKYGEKTIFIDHHAIHSGSDNSATKITYEVLTSLGLLKKEEYLDRLVEFVTQADNKTFPDQGKYFKSSMLTILGLERFIKFENLLQFFKEGRSVTELLSGEDIKKYGLIHGASKQNEIVDKSLAALEEMDKTGLIINSERYGKIAVDIGKKVPGGFDAANYHGCGAYIIWNPDSNGFFVTAINRPLQDDFSQGKKIRDTMWIKNPKIDPSPLTLTLSEILNKMTDNKLEPTGVLAEYLLKEKDTDGNIDKKITANPLQVIINKLKMKYAEEDDPEKEKLLEAKIKLLEGASKSEDPLQVVKNEYVDDNISDEEMLQINELFEPSKNINKKAP
jgi:hypothetical protein